MPAKSQKPTPEDNSTSPNTTIVVDSTNNASSTDSIASQPSISTRQRSQRSQSKTNAPTSSPEIQPVSAVVAIPPSTSSNSNSSSSSSNNNNLTTPAVVDSESITSSQLPAVPTTPAKSVNKRGRPTGPPRTPATAESISTSAPAVRNNSIPAITVDKKDVQLDRLIKDISVKAKDIDSTVVVKSMGLVEIQSEDFGSISIPKMLLEPLEHQEFSSRLYFICYHHTNYQESVWEEYNRYIKGHSNNTSNSSSTTTSVLNVKLNQTEIKQLWERRYNEFLGVGMFHHFSVLVDIAVKLYQSQEAKIPSSEAIPIIIRHGRELWHWSENTGQYHADNQFKTLAKNALILVSYLFNRPMELPLIMKRRVTKTMFMCLSGPKVVNMNCSTILKTCPNPEEGLFLKILNCDEVLMKTTDLGLASLQRLMANVLKLGVSQRSGRLTKSYNFAGTCAPTSNKSTSHKTPIKKKQKVVAEQTKDSDTGLEANEDDDSNSADENQESDSTNSDAEDENDSTEADADASEDADTVASEEADAEIDDGKSVVSATLATLSTATTSEQQPTGLVGNPIVEEKIENINLKREVAKLNKTIKTRDTTIESKNKAIKDLKDKIATLQNDIKEQKKKIEQLTNKSTA